MTSEVTSDLKFELSGFNNPCSSAYLASDCLFSLNFVGRRRRKAKYHPLTRSACRHSLVKIHSASDLKSALAGKRARTPATTTTAPPSSARPAPAAGTSSASSTGAWGKVRMGKGAAASQESPPSTAGSATTGTSLRTTTLSERIMKVFRVQTKVFSSSDQSVCNRPVRKSR